MYLCVCMRVDAAFGDRRVEVERVGGVGVASVQFSLFAVSKRRRVLPA